MTMVLAACPPHVKEALLQLPDKELVCWLKEAAESVYDDLSEEERAELDRIIYELQTISGMGVNSALQLVQRLGLWLEQE